MNKYSVIFLVAMISIAAAAFYFMNIKIKKLEAAQEINKIHSIVSTDSVVTVHEKAIQVIQENQIRLFSRQDSILKIKVTPKINEIHNLNISYDSLPNF